MIQLVFTGLGFVLFTKPLEAQVLSLGAKAQKQVMFQTVAHYVLGDGSSRSAHAYMLGVDYTTKNKYAPSGIMPQATYGYRLWEEKRSDFFVMVGSSAGYNFQLSRDFPHQIKVSPFVYAEYLGVINVKMGYDYAPKINTGYPFISLGLGGFLAFRNFVIGL